MAASRKQKRPGVKPPGRVKKSVLLPAELARSLATYAAWNGRRESDVVADALKPLLAGFYCVPSRGLGAGDAPLALVAPEPGEAA